MSFKKFQEEPVIDSEYHQKVNMEYLILQQITRCNIAGSEGDDIKFANCVERLLGMLPKENRARIQSEKGRAEYVTRIEKPIFKYSCGHPMGSIEHPVYRNNPLDWNYKGGPPELVSPIVEEVEETDYQKLYEMIQGEMEDCGITWKVEPKGNVEKRIDSPPTPVFSEPQGIEAEQVEMELEDEYEEDTGQVFS